MRPRDIIEFINLCIQKVSVDSGVITEEAVLDAELTYSHDRLDSLAYEWFTDYLGLKSWTSILRKQPQILSLTSINDDALIDKCIEYVARPAPSEVDSEDIIHKMAVDVVENRLGLELFKRQLVHVFYKLSIVGLRLEGERNVSWSGVQGRSLIWQDIEDDTDIYIHPCYVSALRVQATA